MKTSAVRRYFLGAEEYINAFPDRRCSLHKRDDLESYFQLLGRKSQLEDWRFHQTVEAIRILFRAIVKDFSLDEVD